MGTSCFQRPRPAQIRRRAGRQYASLVAYVRGRTGQGRCKRVIAGSHPIVVRIKKLVDSGNVRQIPVARVSIDPLFDDLSRQVGALLISPDSKSGKPVGLYEVRIKLRDRFQIIIGQLPVIDLPALRIPCILNKRQPVDIRRQAPGTRHTQQIARGRRRKVNRQLIGFRLSLLPECQPVHYQRARTEHEHQRRKL